MTKFSLRHLVAALATVVSTSALADPVSVTFGPDNNLFRYNPGVVIDLDEVTMGANPLFNDPLSSGPIFAAPTGGEFRVTVTSRDGATTIYDPLYVFCIEIDQGIASEVALDTYERTILTSPGTTGSDDRDNAFADAQKFGLLTSLYNQFIDLADNSDVFAAAMQMAIWELRYDGGTGGPGLSFDTGDFRLAAADASYAGGDATARLARDIAATWLGALTVDDDTQGRSFILLTSNDVELFEFQDLIGFTPDERVPPNETPVPGTLALLGLGALALARKRI